MPFEIEIPLDVICDVFESSTISTGMTVEAPGNATLTILPGDIQTRNLPSTMAYDAAPIFVTIVAFAAGPVSAVAINLFSSWLYEKFAASKTKRRRIRMNRKSVEVTPEGIYKAVEESIVIEEG
jgi:hypothetical protein